MLEDILNFVQLTERVGTAGQPTREQFEDIAAAGYQAVINLALPTSDNAIADEGSVVTTLGMSYFQIPVDFENPTLNDARTFIGLMQALEDRPVFVHCAMNLRVSAFMYVYLKEVVGAEEDAASSPLIPKWRPHMTDVWNDFMELKRADLV